MKKMKMYKFFKWFTLYFIPSYFKWQTKQNNFGFLPTYWKCFCKMGKSEKGYLCDRTNPFPLNIQKKSMNGWTNLTFFFEVDFISHIFRWIAMLSGKKNLNSAFSLAPVLQLIKNPDTVLRIERIAHDCKIAQHDIYIYVLFFFLSQNWANFWANSWLPGKLNKK